MPPLEIARRASYGPTSPVIGQRGARTRQHILDTTLALFAESGFHATLVDDIAQAAGISRATLYQYFESKQQIFVELVEESGSTLMRLVRRLRHLGPTDQDFENLHWWLGEWAWVYDKYATTFIQWASVDSPKAPLRPMLAKFVEGYTTRLSALFVEAGVEGIDPAAAAVAFLAISERFNFYRRTGLGQLSDDVMLDALAVAVQMWLFPATPPTALSVRGTDQPASALALAPAARPPALPVLVPSDRFDGLSEQALGTVRQLLAAGGRVFGAAGYHESSVEHIVTEAGVARGTFYKYFDHKLDLLIGLADECAEHMTAMANAFALITPGGGQAAQLRSWLAEFVTLHERYAGVFRVWTDGIPDDPHLRESGRVVVQTALSAFDTVIGQVKRPGSLDRRAASLMMLAMLERLPEQAAGTSYQLTPEQVVESMAGFIERGLLAQPA
jgi:AcrR family transcriptional regulator